MRYLVIEQFVQGARPVYERAADSGRMLPPGLEYVDSWVDESLERCFQLMETEDPALIDSWIGGWSDLVRFEVVPLISSDETGGARARQLGVDGNSLVVLAEDEVLRRDGPIEAVLCRLLDVR